MLDPIARGVSALALRMRREGPSLVLALLLGCRASNPPSPPPPEPPKRVVLPVTQPELPAPRWDEAANLRLSTVGLSREQLLALRPRELPTFVRVSESGVVVVPCAQRPAARVRFEAELPVHQSRAWATVEFGANVLVGTRLNGMERVEFGFTPAGTYEVEPEQLGPLRYASCETATHFVARARVGRLDWIDGVGPCDVTPDSLEAPPDCDRPWMLELASLDPRAPLGQICPPPTVWSDTYCRAPDETRQRSGPFCDAQTYHVNVCDVRWSGRPSWRHDGPLGIPERLEVDELEAAMAPLTPALHACALEPEPLVIDVYGRSGVVVEVELPASTSAHARACMADVLREASFPTFTQEHQPFRWSPVTGRDPACGDRPCPRRVLSGAL